ncbi:two-component sensor histidine kinase [Pseudoalteromonas sp. HM-SA03]|uniref:sensor histidine kinase n=1 Tax=Pseudoalteromonas sp. HM-SA03 TaxID=2029678 RepID=UPI000BADFE20|nr:ATP-binding protein [Pseudoalteromonas sp. HM-SA03]PAY02865.1 two-component sensor histidine kinase [Pseudoalteromonas sp. HM-SA03]
MFNELQRYIPVGICVLDQAHTVVFANEFLKNRLPDNTPKNIEGMSVDKVFPDAAKIIKRKLKSVFALKAASFSYWEHRPHVFELSSSRPVTGDETSMYQNIQYVPIFEHSEEVKKVCVIIQDVTELASYYQEQKRLTEALEIEKQELKTLNLKLEAAQNQLLQSEKMAAIGQLAAGVAHEINNPIGFVNSNIQSLEGQASGLFAMLAFYEAHFSTLVDSDLAQQEQQLQNQHSIDFLKEDVPDLLQECLEGLDRVSKIVESLKSFSHVDNQEWQEADLIKGIESTLKIANNSIKYHAVINKTYSLDDEVLLYCQPMQINQVFLNLIINAAQSIASSGTVTISIEDKQNEVIIAIQDTGKGIPAGDINKIFNPFFTTKPVGQGTGLGLSLSYSIVAKHKGRIQVDSQVGVGTTFTVSFPKLSEADFSDEFTDN